MSQGEISVEAVKQITEMGFAEDQAVQALQMTGGDVNEALNIIFQGGDLSQAQSQHEEAPEYDGDAYNFPVDEKMSIPIESGLIHDKLPPPSYQDEKPPPVPPRQAHPVHIEDVQHPSQTQIPLSDSAYSPDSGSYRYHRQELLQRQPPQSQKQQQQQQEPEYSIYDDPSKYARPEDVPPLLMPVNGGMLESYLNPFLTILHEIPAFRKAVYHHEFETLGFHPRWYRNEIVNVPDGTTIKVKNGETYDLRFLLEVQRIFGFLDGDSERLFASLTNFVRSFPRTAKKAFGAVDTIYDAYAVFYKTLAVQLEASGVENPLSFFESQIDNTDKTEFGMFHVEAEELKGDLYSTLNNILWDDDLESQQVLSKLSDVITISFEPSYDEGIISKGAEITDKFYPQIYGTEFKETITGLLKERNDIDKERRAISKELMSLRVHSGKSVHGILSTSIEFLSSELKNSEDTELVNALKELETIKSDNQDKITALTDKQNILMDKKSESNPHDINVILKRHGSTPEPYLLTGVILSNNEFYFLRKTHDLIDLDQSQTQWLRVIYEPRYGNDLRYIAADFDDAKRAVYATTQGQYETSIVLIYVKESIWKNQVEYEVPESVKTFISKDKLELEKALELLASSTDEELSDEDDSQDGDGDVDVELLNQEGAISLDDDDADNDDGDDDNKENAPPLKHNA